MIATGISILHKLWLALITVNPIAAKDSKETALATIAGVAAALWAGSLISYQLKAPSLLRLNGLNLLQTAFFGATLTLAIDAVELRFAAIMFGLYYGFFAVRELCAAWTVELFKKATIKRYNVVRTDEEWNRDFRDLRRYLYVMLVTVAIYFIVAKWPYHATVCWVGVIFLFGGYQVVLAVLGTGLDRGLGAADYALQTKLARIESDVGSIAEALTGLRDGKN